MQTYLFAMRQRRHALRYLKDDLIHAIINAMPLSTTQKQEIIQEFKTADGDTGSPEVQIALLTKRIDRLADHLKQHAHDVHSRRGLLSMIAKRRRLINFLKKVDDGRASGIAKKVGLRDN
jgi:small subunit ribosomal protein S15